MNPESTTIGFELEYEGCEYWDHHRLLDDVLGEFGKIKDDGSLSNGFELASRVHCFGDFVGQNYLKFSGLFEQFDRIPDFDLETTTGTGLHFHVDKRALPASQWYKINEFVVNQGNLVQGIAGRPHTSYCKPQLNPLYKFELSASPVGHRLQAINPCGNCGNTVEFRMFQSTLSLECFAARGQFVIGLVDAVKQDALNNVENFLDFVHGNCYTYPQLKVYLDTYNWKK